MSNKQRAVLLIAEDFNKTGPTPLLDLMIQQGNSSLLVLRNAESLPKPLKDIFLFNSITSISQLSNEGPNDKFAQDEQSVIERSFFKRQLIKGHFDELFHNGAFSKGDGLQVLSNSDKILEQAEKYKMNPKKIEEAIIEASILGKAELTIIYLQKSDSSHVEDVLSKIVEYETTKNEKLLKFLALHPFNIKKEHLLPVNENPLLESLIPPQTYLQFGSNKLDFDTDINQNQAILVVEHDQDYMRIDKLTSYDEIVDQFTHFEGNPFLYKYQLAESFMRQVAFKLGKLEKFGA